MKRNKHISFFLYFITITSFILTSSCSESFEDVAVNESENINGFKVQWRSQISECQKATIREILCNMVYVEGEYFVMGATPEQKEYARPNEYPNAYIKLSDYFICKYEITDEQYNIIMGADKAPGKKYSSRITLKEWNLFIELLRDFTSLDFSLPSEAQWEFAARGGIHSKNYIYPGSNNIEEVRSISHLEGSTFPNELGLYNMADLKSEWCRDLYSSLVPGRLLYDWVQDSGEHHVVRGGNFRCTIESDKYMKPLLYSFGEGTTYTKQQLDYRYCRTTFRSYSYDNEPGRDDIGCRVVINTFSK